MDKTLVQLVIHKKTKEKRWIKAYLFNPKIHKEINGMEGEPKSRSALPPKPTPGVTAGGIHVPPGNEKVKPSKAPAAPEAPVVPEAPAAAEAEAEAAPPAAPAESAPEAPEGGDVTLTVENLVEEKSRRELNEMAIELDYPEEQVLDSPNKTVVAEMIVAGKYTPPEA